MLTLFDVSLNEVETNRLTELETVIERGLQTFVDVGTALLEIRDSRLYRNDYSTFEEYCRDRWGWERRHAYRLIDAATVVENVSLGTQIVPTSERQARPLTQLPPDQQREAWAIALDTAPDGKITGAHVQQVVDEIKGNGKPHVSFNTGNNEWYTPPEYIEAARDVMGVIDLDPASSDTANITVNASVYFTIEDDGLRYSWDGRVWMNPPYAGELIGKFTDKLAYHYRAGDVTEAIVLVNNATETGWFQTLLACASAVCFVKGRVRFVDIDGNPSGAPLQGQAILYLGNTPALFGKTFSKFGIVLHERREGSD